MRILLVTPFYSPAYAYGGIPRVVEDHARELARRGYEVTVATTDVHDRASRNPISEEILDGVRVVRFKNISNTLANRLNIHTPRGLDTWLRRNIALYNRVIVHDVYTWLTLRTLARARSARVPYALMPHGTVSPARVAMRHAWAKKLLLAILRPYLREAFAVYAISEREREDVVGVEPLSRVTTLGNGIDLDTLPVIDRASAREGLGIAPGTFAVVFLGRLHPLKRADIALRAFAVLYAEHPDSRLLVAGPDDGELPRLRELADELGIALATEFMGTLTGTAKFTALTAADALVSPSLDEGGRPLVVAEALACGTPCVLSSGCRVPEVGEAGAGIVVDSSEPADYARALAEIRRDPLPYRERTRETARKYFSLSSVIDILVSTLTRHDR